jgi:hypothetical protein
MADGDRSILRVHSYGGIRARQLREFLADVEYAYNGLCGLDVTLARIEAGERYWRRYFPLPLYQPPVGSMPNLGRDDVAALVPPRERLIVEAVRLESPGFWDFLGKTLSLEAINAWLTGRQERREHRRQDPHRRRMEDIDYENRVTEVVLNRYRAAREMGFDPDDLTPLVGQLVERPLRELERHQDSGLIQRTEILPPEAPLQGEDAVDEELD